MIRLHEHKSGATTIYAIASTVAIELTHDGNISYEGKEPEEQCCGNPNKASVV